MTNKNGTYLQDLLEEYESSEKALNLEDRLRYAVAMTMCYEKDANTPDMKRILLELVSSEESTAKQIKSKLVKLFVLSELTSKELTYEFAKNVVHVIG